MIPGIVAGQAMIRRPVDPDAQAIIDEMDPAPDSQLRAAIDGFVRRAKVGVVHGTNAWASIQAAAGAGLWVSKLPRETDQPNSLINWVDPTGDRGTLFNSPTWVAGHGNQGDGVAARIVWASGDNSVWGSFGGGGFGTDSVDRYLNNTGGVANRMAVYRQGNARARLATANQIVGPTAAGLIVATRPSVSGAQSLYVNGALEAGPTASTDNEATSGVMSFANTALSGFSNSGVSILFRAPEVTLSPEQIADLTAAWDWYAGQINAMVAP